MSKIYKLFIDENIKTWKKFSTKLIIAIIVLALVGTLGLVKVMERISENAEVEYSTFNWEENMQNEMEEIKTSLANENLDEENQKMLQIQSEKYELAKKYNINPYSSYWKSSILEEITKLKESDDKETEIQKLEEMIKNDDFVGYIETQKEIEKTLLENKEITQQEYDDKILVLNLKSKFEIGKNEEKTNETWKSVLVNKIETMQRSLRTGIDYENRKVLTVEKKQQYEDTIKMNIYRLENNMPTMDYVEKEASYRMTFELLATNFVISVIAIFAIIIAGSAISSETSTGTIKFWALTPNKRWKILTSKILSLIFFVVIMTLIMSLLTIACGNIFFNAEGNEYLYVKDGQVEKIGNTLFIIEYYFAKIIPVIVFALFALMLSAITRNTSVALSLSVAIYMGNGIAMAIINSYIKKDWIKFIPFNNLNIVDKIFQNFENPMAMLQNFATSTSLGFSLGVLAVCVILMLVTTYDSFNHKDII